MQAFFRSAANFRPLPPLSLPAPYRGTPCPVTVRPHLRRLFGTSLLALLALGIAQAEAAPKQRAKPVAKEPEAMGPPQPVVVPP